MNTLRAGFVVVLVTCFATTPAWSQSSLSGLNNVTEHLPTSTQAVFVVPDVNALLTELGGPEMAKKYATYYNEMSKSSTDMLGINVLDPTQYAQIGVDASKPLGFAVLDDDNFVFFFGISDRDNLASSLQAAMAKLGGVLHKDTVGDAVLLSMNTETLGALLWEDTGLIVIADSKDRFQHLLKTEASSSLASQPEFKSAVAQLPSGGGVEAYLNIRQMMLAPLQRRLARNKAQLTETRKKLDEARRAGSSDVQWLEQDVAWMERSVKQYEAQDKAFKAIVGSQATAALSARVDGPSILMRMKLQLPSGSMLSELFKNGSGEPLLFNVLNQSPLFAVHGTAQPKPWLDMLSIIMEAEGEDMSQLATMIQSQTGVDINTDLPAQLTGEVGFAVTMDLAQMQKAYASKSNINPERFMGGALLLGVQDEAWAKELLGKLAQHKALSALVKETDTGWTFSAPDWRNVYVTVSKGFIGLATDDVVLEGLQSGKGTSFLDAKGTSASNMKGFLLEPNQAATAVIDWMPFGLLTTARGFDQASAKAMVHGGSFKKTATYKKKEAELKAVEEALDKMYDQHGQEDNAIVSRLSGRWGAMAMRCKAVSTGLDCELGQYFNEKSVPDFTLGLTGDIIEMEETDERQWKELEKLYEKRSQLESELFQLSQPQPVTP